MMHRVFLAINLPPEIKKKLADFRQKYPTLPIRWTKPLNLHITLSFLGNLTDEELFKVCESVQEVVKKHQPFVLSLKKITYGPPKKNPPRMIWAEGALEEGPQKKLKALRKDLENALFEVYDKGEEGEGNFTFHVTLGRIKVWEFRQIETEEMPEIDEDISFTFSVESIDVMESELKMEGPEYTILESCPLSS